MFKCKLETRPSIVADLIWVRYSNPLYSAKKKKRLKRKLLITKVKSIYLEWYLIAEAKDIHNLIEH